MEVVIIGLGLIGGSFAKGIKRLYPNATLIGIDTNADHLTEALEIGFIDVKGDTTALKTADMVVVSIPVDVMVNQLPAILDAVK